MSGTRLAVAATRDTIGGMRSIGVEEELLVVDAGGAAVPLGPDALAAASRWGRGHDPEEHDRADRSGDGSAHLVPELMAQQIELGTSVATTLDEVDRQLRPWRGRAAAAAATTGARVAALATSPLPADAEPTAAERYTAMVEHFGPVATAQLTCGCHVHVSVADGDEGVAVLDRIRPWLPVLTALSANSPFRAREDTGVAALLDRGTGADLQREVLASTGDLGAVVAAAVALTSGQDEVAARAAVRPTG